MPRRARRLAQHPWAVRLFAGAQSGTPTPMASPGPLMCPMPVTKPLADPQALRVDLLSLKEGMCRWPLGDPWHEDFAFCGGQTAPGLPYCDFHARIAYQPLQRRRRSCSKINGCDHAKR